MDNPDRPVFTPEIDFHIEQVQNQADRLAWQQLRALQVPTAISRKMMKAAYPPEFVGPPDPQKPKEILLHIRTYARTLYLAEGNFYQTGAHVEEQLRKLADRIVERVGNRCRCRGICCKAQHQPFASWCLDGADAVGCTKRSERTHRETTRTSRNHKR